MIGSLGEVFLIRLILIRKKGLAQAHVKGIDARNANRYHFFAMNDTKKPEPLAPPATPRPAAGGTLPRFDSVELLGTAAAVVIVHNGREYLLRVTQNGKLILTA